MSYSKQCYDHKHIKRTESNPKIFKMSQRFTKPLTVGSRPLALECQRRDPHPPQQGLTIPGARNSSDMIQLMDRPMIATWFCPKEVYVISKKTCNTHCRFGALARGFTSKIHMLPSLSQFEVEVADAASQVKNAFTSPHRVGPHMTLRVE